MNICEREKERFYFIKILIIIGHSQVGGENILKKDSEETVLSTVRAC